MKEGLGMPSRLVNNALSGIGDGLGVGPIKQWQMAECTGKHLSRVGSAIPPIWHSSSISGQSDFYPRYA